MSDIDTEKAIASKLDPKSQTLIYRARKFHYRIQDAFQWAARVKSGSCVNPPMPTLIWTLGRGTDPVKNPALLSALNDAYMNALTYRGLLSQAEDMLRDYPRQ
jgi:hypothetical protein